MAVRRRRLAFSRRPPRLLVFFLVLMGTNSLVFVGTGRDFSWRSHQRTTATTMAAFEGLFIAKKEAEEKNEKKATNGQPSPTPTSPQQSASGFPSQRTVSGFPASAPNPSASPSHSSQPPGVPPPSAPPKSQPASKKVRGPSGFPVEEMKAPWEMFPPKQSPSPSPAATPPRPQSGFPSQSTSGFPSQSRTGFPSPQAPSPTPAQPFKQPAKAVDPGPSPQVPPPQKPPKAAPPAPEAKAEKQPQPPKENGFQQDPDSFYAVLKVPETARLSDLRAAYRQEARRSHPDMFRTASEAEQEAAAERFAKVNQAFDVLSDPAKRQAYDLRGLAGLAEFEFDGERIIMPPPWRVRIGHTGHHFWKRKEYFVGLMMETIDIPVSVIVAAYEEATKDPPGVGQATLVERCTEARATDIAEELQEYGIICLAEEVPDEELLDPAMH
mmetsp:Transcript_69233/g.162718  ORF Transcript_69233/g.162718 Transcript_69233/m.162718 type:complete len:439 (+) Transcript_69233:468-1784(+)